MQHWYRGCATVPKTDEMGSSPICCTSINIIYRNIMIMEILIASFVVILGLVLVFVLPKKFEKNNTQTTSTGGHTSHPSGGGGVGGGENHHNNPRPEHNNIITDEDDEPTPRDERIDSIR